MAVLGPVYGEALAYASELHREQRRKGGDVPYVAHLLAVTSLVLEAGGDQDQAIGALLHDALEDQGDKTSFEEIARRFGTPVAEIVRACSDTEVTPKPPWRERKQAYLDRLAEEDLAPVLVSAADKLHNARSILADRREVGERVWDRFSVGVEEQRWYYTSLVEVLGRRLPGNRLVDELARVVDELFA